MKRLPTAIEKVSALLEAVREHAPLPEEGIEFPLRPEDRSKEISMRVEFPYTADTREEVQGLLRRHWQQAVSSTVPTLMQNNESKINPDNSKGAAAGQKKNKEECKADGKGGEGSKEARRVVGHGGQQLESNKLVDYPGPTGPTRAVPVALARRTVPARAWKEEVLLRGSRTFSSPV